MKLWRLLVVVALAGTLAVACGGDDGDGGGGGGGTATDTVTMTDTAYQPSDPVVGSGTTLTLTNEGAATHSFTLEDQSIDEVVAAGESTSVELTLEPGTYDFDCTFHPELTGTLTVE